MTATTALRRDDGDLLVGQRQTVPAQRRHPVEGSPWIQLEQRDPTARRPVERAVVALPDVPKNAAIVVSPFGSESFGTALISSITDGVLVQQVCIFRKAEHTAELATPFAPAP